MGQKINPHGLRVGVIQDWDSRWFVKNANFGDTLVSDYKIRKMLKKQLFLAGVPKIEIERDQNRVRVSIHCAKPGIVIGKAGAEIDKLRAAIEELVKPLAVSVNVTEVKRPDMNAQLVAENIAGQLERRISFRRAMKQAISRTMKEDAKGIKIAVGGRLGGAEIARSEHYHEGTIPLQTLRADIDYGFWEANTTFGKIGVKVWIYKGEVLAGSKATTRRPIEEPSPKTDRRDRRPRNDNRGGDNRGGGYNNAGGGNRTGGYNNAGGNRTGGGGYNSGNRTGGYNNNAGGGNRTGGYSGGGGGYNGGNRTGGYNSGNRTGGYAGGNRPAPNATSGAVAPNANKEASNSNADSEKS
jgi:small subunit ribosomal protein S3